MTPLFLFLIVSLLVQTKANAESISPRISIHEDIDLKDLAPTYQKAPKFGVGFKILTLQDPWRENVMAFDNKPVPKNRRILANIWYPAPSHKDSMFHSNYYDADPGTEPYANAYLEQTRRFRRLLQYQESVAKTGFVANTPIKNGHKIQDPQAFQRGIPALRNAPLTDGRFPLLFYHSGAQGGFEENAPLFEYLASQGIVVVAVIGPPEEGGFDVSSRSVELLWEDVNLTLAELERDSHFDTTRIAFLGFSMGAQHTLNFALSNRRFAAAVLFDTTFENQDFKDFPIESKARLEERGPSIHTPFLILSAIAADFGKKDRFRIYQSLKNTPALLVDFGREVNHDDFTWHGLVNRAAQVELDRDGFRSAMKRYERVGDLTLDFLSEAFSSQPDWSRLSSLAKTHLSDHTFRRVQIGVPSINPNSRIIEILADESTNREASLKLMLAQNSVSTAYLNSLIKQVRYTHSSEKALSLCKSLTLAKLDDPVPCIAIALESNDPESAKVFSDYFFATRKKPKKNDQFFKKIQYSDAEQLRGMIADPKFRVKGEEASK